MAAQQRLVDRFRRFEQGAGEFDEPRPGVLRLTLNRPERWNPISHGMHQSLPGLFAAIADDSAVEAFILRGSGEVFSSGGDVDENIAIERDAAEVVSTGRIGVRIITRLLEIPQPTLCLVNGPALGFAANLALSFDFVVAAEDAYFKDTHVAFGLVPGDGASYIWPLAFGPARTREILLCAAPVSAEEAHRVGLVNRVVPLAQLDDEGWKLFDSLLANAPLATRLGKMAVNTPLRAYAEETMNLSNAASLITFFTEDFRRAVDGFVKDRRFDQNWEGR